MPSQLLPSCFRRGKRPKAAGVVIKKMNPRKPVSNFKRLKERRRELRSTLTTAEAALWKCLQRAQLDGKKFRRQHSIGPYVLDFYALSAGSLSNSTASVTLVFWALKLTSKEPIMSTVLTSAFSASRTDGFSRTSKLCSNQFGRI